MIKTVVRGFVVSLSIILLAPAAIAQQLALPELQSKLVASWIATVEGEARKRVMVVEALAQKGDGVFQVNGSFNFVDDAKAYPMKGAEVLTSSGNITFVMTTAANSLYTGSLGSDGAIKGTVKYATGQVKTFRMEKGSVAAELAALRALDGKWSGDAYPVGSSCVRGVYDLEIKEGKVTGTATFQATAGVATSLVTGQVRPDKSVGLALARQQPFGRSSRLVLNADGEQLKGRDQGSGGPCTYDVTLKKG